MPEKETNNVNIEPPDLRYLKNNISEATGPVANRRGDIVLIKGTDRIKSERKENILTIIKKII